MADSVSEFQAIVDTRNDAFKQLSEVEAPALAKFNDLVNKNVIDGTINGLKEFYYETHALWAETARRYDLPIVAVLWNNSSWGPSVEEMPYLNGRTDPFEMLPGQRYDRMFELMGCHGEHVEQPADFRHALERSLNAGTTAVINVVGDRRIGHPSLGGNLLGSTTVR